MTCGWLNVKNILGLNLNEWNDDNIASNSMRFHPNLNRNEMKYELSMFSNWNIKTKEKALKVFSNQTIVFIDYVLISKLISQRVGFAKDLE